MKIAILGTRGIPNNYGGPEAGAEFMGPIFRRLGHEVTVYSPDEHPFREKSWNGVHIRRVFNRESRLGIWGTFIYDYLCLRDAMRADFDIVLELGYVPAAIFYPFRRRGRARLITNMDGLEWKRSKWNSVLQRFAMLTERLAVRHSDALISDNAAIREYLLAKFGRDSYFIPYGAQAMEESPAGPLAAYGVRPGGYFMLIARMEPENNLEMALDGYLASGDARPFLVVGKTNTPHGGQLVEKYRAHEGIRFLGGIYDYAVLSSLRRHCALYFHGHSVGGTNPSLVEAMASRTLIAAHDNPFNRSVLEAGGFYFSSAAGVAALLRADHSGQRGALEQANLARVDEVYEWEKIAREHLRAFAEVMERAP